MKIKSRNHYLLALLATAATATPVFAVDAIFDNLQVNNQSWVWGDSITFGDAFVDGNVEVNGTGTVHDTFTVTPETPELPPTVITTNPNADIVLEPSIASSNPDLYYVVSTVSITDVSTVTDVVANGGVVLETNGNATLTKPSSTTTTVSYAIQTQYEAWNNDSETPSVPTGDPATTHYFGGTVDADGVFHSLGEVNAGTWDFIEPLDEAALASITTITPSTPGDGGNLVVGGTANIAGLTTTNGIANSENRITGVTDGIDPHDAVNVSQLGTETTARTAADTAIRTDFAAADTAIRTDFAAADTVVANDSIARDTAIRTDFAAADNVVRSEFAAADTVVANDSIARDNAIRVDFAAADNVVRSEFAAADTVVANESIARDNAIRVDFAAADNVVRSEFAAADNVVRSEFAAADTVVANESIARDNAIRVDFAAADDVVRTEFAAADAAEAATREQVDTLIRSEFAAADNVVRTEFAAADAAEAATREQVDTLIRSEFAAADNVVRTEFAAADNVVRSEFAAADTTERLARQAADTSIRMDFAAADTAVTNASIARDNALGYRIDDEAATRSAADSRLNSDIKKNTRGIAMVAAMTNSTVQPGKSQALDVNMAQFDGKTGFALGYAHIINENIQVHGALASTSDFDESVFRLGVSFQW